MIVSKCRKCKHTNILYENGICLDCWYKENVQEPFMCCKCGKIKPSYIHDHKFYCKDCVPKPSLYNGQPYDDKYDNYLKACKIGYGICPRCGKEDNIYEDAFSYGCRKCFLNECTKEE